MAAALLRLVGVDAHPLEVADQVEEEAVEVTFVINAIRVDTGPRIVPIDEPLLCLLANALGTPDCFPSRPHHFVILFLISMFIHQVRQLS